MIDQDLLTALQYDLLELPNGGASWPSGLWTRDEVLASLSERQARLLKDALVHVKVSSPIAVAATTRRVALPSDWVRTLSVVWTTTATGAVRELLRSDSFEADHGLKDYLLTDNTPFVYFEYDAGQLEMELAPAPIANGTLTLLYVPAGTALNGNGVALTIPDILAHGQKYGTLADLLAKDGRGRDASRAAYSEQRFQLAIDAARILLKGWA